MTDEYAKAYNAGYKYGLGMNCFGRNSRVPTCPYIFYPQATLTMVLKLYGTYISPWVRLVAAVLKEKEVPFEFIPVNMSKREHKSPEYLSKQPFGQVPYIVGHLLTKQFRSHQRILGLD